MSHDESSSSQLRPKLVEVEGRIPPHDLDAEGAVLSAVMVDPAAMDRVADILRSDHFYAEAHRRIFEAALEVHGRGVPLDVVTVATELRDRERLPQVGGPSYLTEILNAAPAVTNVRTYAETVRQKWMAREVLRVCHHGVASGYSDYGDVRDYVNGISQSLYEIASTNSTETTHSIKESLAAHMTDMADAAKRGATIVGMSTGFDRYDRMTAGLHDGELTIVAGRPGMGKTALVCDILQHVTAAEGQAGILFSLEMPHKHVTARMLCSRARVDFSRMRNGSLSPSDWTKLTDASVQLSNLHLWIDDQSGLSFIELRSRARRAASEAASKGLRLRIVGVDYLQLMSGEGDEGNREQEVSRISRGLKSLAKDLGLPVIALAQLNRKPEDRGKNKRPQLSDLRESGAIEQDADNICFIYRDDYYNKDSTDRNVAELIVAKQRSGPTDTVRVRFDAQYTRFDNLPDGDEYDQSESRFP